jgi:hypothetical protein
VLNSQLLGVFNYEIEISVLNRQASIIWGSACCSFSQQVSQHVEFTDVPVLALFLSQT